MRGNVAAIVLILVGSFMLLTNLGVIAVGVGLFLTPERIQK